MDDSPIPDRSYFYIKRTQRHIAKRHPLARAVFLFPLFLCCSFLCLFYILSINKKDFEQVFWGGNILV